jgi:hypothetical protein
MKKLEIILLGKIIVMKDQMKSLSSKDSTACQVCKKFIYVASIPCRKQQNNKHKACAIHEKPPQAADPGQPGREGGG